MRDGPAFHIGDRIPVFLEESHALPLVDLDVILLRGSLLDPVGLEGLTRLTTRLMRRGPTGVDGETFDARLDGLGATFGMTVSPEMVRIYGSVIRRNLDAFLAEVASVLMQPGLRREDFDRLIRRSQAELVALRDHDSALAGRAFRRALFGAHPYGRSVSGTLGSIGAITLDAVRASHAALVRSRHLIVGLSGDVTPADARTSIAAAFAGVAKGSTPRPRARAARTRPGRHVVLIDKPQRTQTQVYIGTLGVKAGDPRTHAMIVANTAFGGTFTSRLMHEVRSERGWSYGAYSKLGADRQRDAWSMWTHPSSEQLLDCLRLELALYEDWHQRGLTQGEVRRAKRYLIKGHAFDRETASKRLEPKLQTAAYGLPDDWFSGYERRIRAVKTPAANEAVRSCLSRDDLTIAVLATASPQLERALRELPGVKSVHVESFDAV